MPLMSSIMARKDGQARLMDHSGMNPQQTKCQPDYDRLGYGVTDDVSS